MSYLSDLQTGNFDELILQSSGINLVYFTANYCRPCHKYGIFLKDLDRDQDLEFNIGEVNIQTNIDLRRQFNIRLLPTTIFFSDGEVIERKEGILSVEEIYEVFNLV